MATTDDTDGPKPLDHEALPPDPREQGEAPPEHFPEPDEGAEDDDAEVADEGALVPLGAILEEIQKRTAATAEETALDVLKRARTPPHALDAERAVLGALLLEPSSYEQVIDEGLRPDDFYRPAHGTIFRVVQALHAAAEPIDTLTVVDELLKNGQLDAVGGAAAVSQLEAMLPTAAHVGAYARLVREKSTLRHLIETSTNIVQSAYRQDKRVVDIIDEAERDILKISEGHSKRSIVPMRELVERATKQLEKAFNNKSAITGVATGFRDLDNITSGLQPGELIIVAARPSMGKTAFTLNLASHVATRLSAPVMFFSLEMGAEQLVQRLIGSEARIDISNLRRGFIQRHEWSKLAEASGRLSEAPFYIDETPSITVSEMRNKCRRQMHETGLSLVIVDYLQLMQGDRGDNRGTEISEISKGLKIHGQGSGGARARALAAQPRGGAARREAPDDERPARVRRHRAGRRRHHAFIYRDEIYNPDSPDKGLAEVIVAKQRNGPTGTVELRFFSNITRFDNLDRVHDEYAG
jgi:replicative DNA helicase